MGGNVEIYEHEIPGLEDAGSPQSVLIYEAIEITNDVVLQRIKFQWPILPSRTHN